MNAPSIPHYHSLGWFGDNTLMIDFLADLLFNAFAGGEQLGLPVVA